MSGVIMRVFLLISFCFLSLAQELISGRIFDEAGMPLYFVLVRNLNSGDFTVSDTNGYFEIQASEKDTLFFKSLGYYSHQLAVRDLQNHQNVQIFLKANPIVLKSIDIMDYRTNSKPSRRLENLYVRGKTSSFGYFSMGLDFGDNQNYSIGKEYIVVSKVVNKKAKPFLIKNVMFRVQKQGNCVVYCVLRVLSRDSTGKPGKDLFRGVAMTNEDFTEPYCTISLEPYGLIIPGKSSVFVGLELLGYKGCDYQNSISLATVKSKSCVAYSRFNTNGNWKCCLVYEGKYSKPNSLTQSGYWGLWMKVGGYYFEEE